MRSVSWTPLILAIVLGAALSPMAWADSPNIDKNALIAVGGRNEKRVAVAPATWTVVNTLPNGLVVTVSALHSGDKTRFNFWVGQGAQRTDILRILSRDGFWYVNDKTGFSKYRPYEYTAESPLIYFCLQRSAPIFTDRKSSFLTDPVETIDGNIATFSHPLVPEQANQLKAAVAQMEELAPKYPGGALPPDIKGKMADLKNLLAHGTTVRVDLTTGQVVEFGSEKMRTRISEFQFLPKADEAAFATNDRQWQDFSDDPTTGSMDDMIMIGNAPGVHPGDKNYDLDGRLMNVKTGRFRRIPFHGATMMPAGFLPGRRSVIVSGLDGNAGGLRPYQIDLATGQNRALGAELLDAGNTLGGDVSPDGKTVAAVHLDPTAGLLKSHVCLIDLHTAQAKFLGKPMDTSFVSWTADGNHLVLVDRQYTDLSADSIESIALMDMDGKVTRLCRGKSPTLLADRRVILFEDPNSGLWTTCDLQGHNAKLFAGGLKGYGFPSASPDGKRILMMHFIPGQLPEPVVLPLGEPTGQAITTTGGLWGMPIWR